MTLEQIIEKVNSGKWAIHHNSSTKILNTAIRICKPDNYENMLGIRRFYYRKDNHYMWLSTDKRDRAIVDASEIVNLKLGTAAVSFRADSDTISSPKLPAEFLVWHNPHFDKDRWKVYIDWLNATYRLSTSKKIDGTLTNVYYGIQDGNIILTDDVRRAPTTPIIHLEEWESLTGIKRTDMKQDGTAQAGGPIQEIIGYKLTKPAYKEAVKSLLRCENFDFKKFETVGEKDFTTVKRELTSAMVLDLWFEPVYKVEAKTIRMGGENGFDLVVEGGKVKHKGTDITEYVKLIQKDYSTGMQWHTTKIVSYDFHIKDIILSKTGCENKETLLSEWLAIKLD